MAHRIPNQGVPILGERQPQPSLIQATPGGPFLILAATVAMDDGLLDAIVDKTSDAVIAKLIALHQADDEDLVVTPIPSGDLEY